MSCHDAEHRQKTLWLIAGLPYSGRDEFAVQKCRKKPTRLTFPLAALNYLCAYSVLDSGKSADEVFVLGASCGKASVRKRITAKAHSRGYRVVCCFLRSHADECTACAIRSAKPKSGCRKIISEYECLEIPDYSEGYEKLLYVKHQGDGSYAAEDWLSGDEL